MNLSFFYELNEGRGEDAIPLQCNNAIGVFDGLGGSGTMKHNSESYGVKTSAYIGSRAVKDYVEKFITGNPFIYQNDSQLQEYTNKLRDYVAESINIYIDQNDFSLNDRVKSQMFKLLPTTMAVALINERESDVEVITFWAGDSRIYSLNSEDGLAQLSIDDITVNQDAMMNIYSDAPLNNFINGTVEFGINHARYIIKKPAIIFAATDGVYNYYDSPMELERSLVRVLSQKNNSSIMDIEKGIMEEIIHITADDATFAGKTCGYHDITEIQSLFHNRKRKFTYYDELKSNYKSRESDILNQREREKEKLTISISLASDIRFQEIRDEYKSLLIDLLQNKQRSNVEELVSLENDIIHALYNRFYEIELSKSNGKIQEFQQIILTNKEIEELKQKKSRNMAILQRRLIGTVSEVNNEMSSIGTNSNSNKNKQWWGVKQKEFNELINTICRACSNDTEDRQLIRRKEVYTKKLQQVIKKRYLPGFSNILKSIINDNEAYIIFRDITIDQKITEYIEGVNALQTNLQEALYTFIEKKVNEEIKLLNNQYYSDINRLWMLYKPTYERYLIGG